ncbi:hypothetical protein KVR01_008427 [Diaporthe batatas]|uniref:uncharacterized protein n=1 Tax=Diaporthe batatas TaxID=748121 RepID=UPI001D04B4CD|nr:uncharacterized protein KVR01_008427 [Diaporthe batatas]KAG8161440.1 hypothetical protein KVR01_008427 [Diaporthe batatas]
MTLSPATSGPFPLRVHGRAGRSQLSPQMDPQLRGAATPRLYALFLPSGLLACMHCTPDCLVWQAGSNAVLVGVCRRCALWPACGHPGDVNLAGLQE